MSAYCLPFSGLQQKIHFHGLWLQAEFSLLLFSCKIMSDSMMPLTAVHQASLSFTISLSLLKFISMMLFNHLILCHPLRLLPSIFPSNGLFSNALCIRWPKYWSFSRIQLVPCNCLEVSIPLLTVIWRLPLAIRDIFLIPAQSSLLLRTSNWV